jgi:unspecific monooxygenase
MTGDPTVQVLGDPRPFWRSMELPGPVAQDEATGALVVFGYDEINALAHDRRMAGVGLTWFDLMGIQGALRDWYGSLMFTNEGAPHDRLRRLVSRAFTPRSVERLRPYVQQQVHQALGRIVTEGGDLVTA